MKMSENGLEYYLLVETKLVRKKIVNDQNESSFFLLITIGSYV